MNKTLIILKNELITVVTRRSYMLTLILVPLIPFVVFTIIGALGANNTAAVGQFLSGTPSNPKPEGYIDQGGVIKQMPVSNFVPAGRFIAYQSLDLARADLAQGKIPAYYVVPADYLETGKVYYVRSDFNPLTGMDQSAAFQYVLRYNLLGQDSFLTDRINYPLDVTMVSLAPTQERDQNSAIAFFLPYSVTMLLYIVILTSSGLLLNSITTEKQNRVIEILLVSVRPIEMLTGKIIALGIAGLLQTVIWSGAGLLLLRSNGKMLSIPAGFQLPASIVVWGAVFFLVGYALYASFMAGVGALVPNLREASQATTIMVLPMIVPLMFLTTLIQDSNGPISVGLSLFPLTAPVAMMTRLAAGDVPIWQPFLAAGIVLVTAGLVTRAVAGMFRAQTLLSGQTFSMKLFFATMAGR